MQLQIEKLVYGGAGLARTDAGVVFVDGVLPGEQVVVEILQQKKDFARSRLVEVLEPSPSRRPGACPNQETVGCCDWSFIQPEAQIALKEAILRESLTRLGGLDWAGPIPRITGPDTGYRLRATFHVAGDRPGFLKQGTREAVPIERCAALMPELNAFLGPAAEAIRSGRFAGAETIRAIVSPTSGKIAAVFRRGREKALWTTGSVGAEVGGIHYRLRPEGFFQPNRYLLEPLQNRVVHLAGTPHRVLDMFAGDGFFTLPLARRADHVVGVDRRSRANARRNAQLNRLENVAFVQASSGAFLRKETSRFDTILLDPPRGGAGQSLARRIGSLGAARIVYVSCNPTTLAADGRAFVESGYHLSHIELVDQFPNTHHIEAIALFARSEQP